MVLSKRVVAIRVSFGNISGCVLWHFQNLTLRSLCEGQLDISAVQHPGTTKQNLERRMGRPRL